MSGRDDEPRGDAEPMLTPDTDLPETRVEPGPPPLPDPVPGPTPSTGYTGPPGNPKGMPRPVERLTDERPAVRGNPKGNYQPEPPKPPPDHPDFVDGPMVRGNPKGTPEWERGYEDIVPGESSTPRWYLLVGPLLLLVLLAIVFAAILAFSG